MAPRAASPGSGLRGPGQEVFPDQARERARHMGLYPDEIMIWRHTRNGSAGATYNTYEPDDDPVRGRVDPTSSNTAGGLRGDAFEDESSEHLVTFDETIEITLEDELEFHNKRWIITSLRERTDRLVTRVEVRTK